MQKQTSGWDNTLWGRKKKSENNELPSWFLCLFFFHFSFVCMSWTPTTQTKAPPPQNPPHRRLRVSTPQRLAVKMPPQPDARHKSPLFMSVCAYLCLCCHQLWLRCNSYFPLFFFCFFLPTSATQEVRPVRLERPVRESSTALISSPISAGSWPISNVWRLFEGNRMLFRFWGKHAFLFTSVGLQPGTPDGIFFF